MSVSDKAVRELHTKLLQIEELESQIARCPLTIQASKSRLDAIGLKVEACRESIKKLRMTADQKQLHQREREAKLKDLEGKLNTASNNREYQMLKDQIAADSLANSILSDEIFEILEEIDSIQSLIANLKEEVQLADAETKKVIENTKKRFDMLTEELDRVRGVLQSLEAELPSDFKSDYSRLVSSRGADGLSPLDLKSCGGCNTNVTPRVLDKLRMGQPVPCPSCGRLLYRQSDD